ncbi:hypothetical protein V494_03468 [Pseudogymnoascus sp. VKM F-4513 (FW-928)]|nr:hypothetical protein V494_03468 [Pseudogymnoascus sp. VKM F-4513 (FW-928)]
MDETITTLCERLKVLLEKNPASSRRRILVAFAGTPGSGKTTISAALTKVWNEELPSNASITVLPMDGFHYPKSVLSTLQNPKCAFRRRGAPFTFDAEAFVKLVKALRESSVTEVDDPSQSFHAPSFDHAVKDPIENDIYIPSSQRIVILEGNYLLLNEHPWDQVQHLVDESWFVSISRETAKNRLVKRHLQAGIETTTEAAALRAEENDLRNGDHIKENMVCPNFIIESSDV